ncbi:MAG: thioredoxin family protein [Candidatus Bathyarchaeia archaeon]
MGSVKKEKIEIMYFYSDLYESRRSLLPIVKKLKRKRPDIRVHLINVEDPENEDLTENYGVKSVPLVIFLTPKGEVASRKSVPLSDEDTIDEIAERVIKGDLPKPEVNELKRKILESFKSVSRRNELTQLISEQIESDILEADSEKEIYDAINLYISVINHTINDLEDYRRVLQKYMVRQKNFIV